MDHSKMSTEEISILSLTSVLFRKRLVEVRDPAERKRLILEHIKGQINRMHIKTVANLLVYLYKSQSAILPVLQVLTQECAATEILKIAEEEARQTAPR